MFADGLSVNFQVVAVMFWVSKQKLHLFKIAQHAETLLEQTRQLPRVAVAPVQYSDNERRVQ